MGRFQKSVRPRVCTVMSILSMSGETAQAECARANAESVLMQTVRKNAIFCLDISGAPAAGAAARRHTQGTHCGTSVRLASPLAHAVLRTTQLVARTSALPPQSTLPHASSSSLHLQPFHRPVVYPFPSQVRAPVSGGAAPTPTHAPRVTLSEGRRAGLRARCAHARQGGRR